VALRERLRIRLGRNPHPSAGIADSQSAKTTGVGGEARGYDGGKKVRGILSVISWWIRKVWY
jgi:putative transposase